MSAQTPFDRDVAAPAFERGGGLLRRRDDPASGLRAYVALHRRWRAPSVGGCRFKTYASDAEAIADVERLAAGMTAKSVMAGLPYGGAKAVMLAPERGGEPSEPSKREAMFEAMGAFVESFGGRFRSGEDMGVGAKELGWMARRTDFVAGAGEGDPSEATADGLVSAAEAALKHVHGASAFRGRRFVISGLGKVGLRFARKVKEAGGEIVGADIDEARVASAASAFGLTPTAIDEAPAIDADIFAPCAVGGVLDAALAARLGAKIVLGSANNQLADDAAAAALSAAGVLYCPDYVVNAGGLLAVAAEIEGWSERELAQRVGGIGGTIRTILKRARSAGGRTDDVADAMANARIAHFDAECVMIA